MASSSESFTESSDSEVEVGLFNEKGKIISVQNKKKTKFKCKFSVTQTKLFIHLDCYIYIIVFNYNNIYSK